MAEVLEKNTVIVNLIDTDGDGKIDMLSFMNEKGSVGLAVTNLMGTVEYIHIFQDVTGDGVLDQDDELRLRDAAEEIVARYPKDHPEQLVIEL